MSEPAAKPSPEPPSEPLPDAAAEPQPAAPSPPLLLLSWLSGIGFVVLAVGLLWVWQHPSPQPGAAQVAALSQQLDELRPRLASLEHRPVPAPQPPPDQSAIEARLKALEQRPADTVATPDLAPLSARITALEQRRPPDLGPLQSQIAALTSRDQTAQGELTRRLDAADARLTALERIAGRAAQIQAARIALDSGLQLGALPGAPPALARFAAAKPPTESQLVLAFTPAATAALAASRPATDGLPLLDRIWRRAQDLVTIRQGDRVIVGDPAAGVLARAHESLDAGDLAGAVAAVASLTGSAAQPMANWLTQARALLDARAALAAWAAQG